ncbi:MAG: Asp-tRNA(Asn)/Glu-tRNA(Gln) amidotransferase subunit GatB [Promethearchaeota archaeon]
METMMGLEVHVHLLTNSKLFCSCSTDYDGKEPNKNTCPICLGFPGTKPKLNKRAVSHGVAIASALNCEILPEINFSRKNYFYPDMPKNFQITQYEIPLAENGHLIIEDKAIRVKRIHLEEDPAKLIHVGGDITSAQYNLIDNNRAGIPLVEIVTEPDISSTKEARQFLEKLSLIMEHLSIFDPTREGAIRIDANISIEKGQRVEVKNITGFKNVEKALNYEIVRQKSLTNMGIDISRETRHFDSERETTSSLRKKEYEDDYGYIIEPDLVTICITHEMIEKIVSNMPELPDHRIQRFIKQYKLPLHQSRIIVHTGIDLSNFFEKCITLYDKPLVIANWIVTFLLKSLNFESLSIRTSKVKPETFVELLELIDEGKISERLAKELIKDYTVSGKSPRLIVKEKNLGLLRGEELKNMIKSVINENPKAVIDYHSGRTKAVDYLLGQVLRRIQARARPEVVKRLITEYLESKRHASVAQ